MSGSLVPDPILEAVDSFSGSFIDLDRRLTVTADEFKGVAQDLEASVRKEGVVPGDRVVTAVGNGPMFPAMLAAILRTGGSPILVHADTPPAEIQRVAGRFGATFLVSDTLREEDLEVAGFLGHEFTPAGWARGICARILEGERALVGLTTVEAVPLHPTSGTTGIPKLAVRPGAAAVAEAKHYIETIGIDRRDLILCTIPMSHAYGYGMCVIVPLVSSATVASMRRHRAPAAAEALLRHRVTIYPSAPFALDLLLAEDSLPPPPRCITSAGAPLPERTAVAASERWRTTIRPLYGTTETGGISVARPDHNARAISSVGPSMGGVSVSVRVDERTDGLPTTGNLWIRSSSMMEGYLKDDGIDRSELVDEWFDTGDLADVDEAGDINLRGRVSEVINVFGMKVLPSEVEEAIALLPQVAEVKVYGSQNRWGSQSVRAAVVASSDLAESTLRAHCREHLVGYKRPEYIAILERLPRSHSGKIVLAELP